MQLHFEQNDAHSIQSYNDTQIKVNHLTYHQSIIISRDTIISDWSIQKEQSFHQTHLEPLLQLKPELILIGHTQSYFVLSSDLLSFLFEQKIGVECMPIGSACRTFNVLLHEERAVVLGIIF
jgi:uncharacterized protein